jgi:hypothetical protein
MIFRRGSFSNHWQSPTFTITKFCLGKGGFISANCSCKRARPSSITFRLARCASSSNAASAPACRAIHVNGCRSVKHIDPSARKSVTMHKPAPTAISEMSAARHVSPPRNKSKHIRRIIEIRNQLHQSDDDAVAAIQRSISLRINVPVGLFYLG